MLNGRPHKKSSRTCDEPSMAPKRKESSPKSVCCTSDTRVLLHECDQLNLGHSSIDRQTRTDLGTLRARWIRARRRMRLTPEWIAKARVPAPGTKGHSSTRNQEDAKRATTHEDPHEDRVLDTPIYHGPQPPVRHDPAKPSCVLREDVPHSWRGRQGCQRMLRCIAAGEDQDG